MEMFSFEDILDDGTEWVNQILQMVETQTVGEVTSTSFTSRPDITNKVLAEKLTSALNIVNMQNQYTRHLEKQTQQLKSDVIVNQRTVIDLQRELVADQEQQLTHLKTTIVASVEDTVKTELGLYRDALQKSNNQSGHIIKEEIKSRNQMIFGLAEETEQQVLLELFVKPSIVGLENCETKKERKKRDDEARREEMELDYLAPFLARIGDPAQMTAELAQQLKEDCLEDLKQRLIDMANLIQGRFEKETQQLQWKQNWYQQNQTTMTKEEEEEYVSYCSEAMFRIHILEERLNRHKELAPQKYVALESRLRGDNRLAEFLN